MQVCESCLKKCYGSDLERLSKIKGETINKHTPIFVRINLLNVTDAYYKIYLTIRKKYIVPFFLLGYTSIPQR